MKVFISWSGALSKTFAHILKKYLPCVIQNIDVFCSSQDISKGEGWDSRLTSELANSNFGIVCLTRSNMDAPWIYFEAGAIAKTLNSRVTALMIELKPSDIQGPLQKFQATSLDESDLKKLFKDINKISESPRDAEIINDSFDAFWPNINASINEALRTQTEIFEVNEEHKKTINEDAIEEILQIVRKQSVLLSNPELLFPFEALSKALVKPLSHPSSPSLSSVRTLYNVTDSLDRIKYANINNTNLCEDLTTLQNEIMRVIRSFEHSNPEILYSDEAKLLRTMVYAPANELRVNEAEEMRTPKD